MKKEVLKKWAVVLFLGFASAACGTDSGTGSGAETDSEMEASMDGDSSVYGATGGNSQPGNPDAYIPGTQSCSDVFISGYNGIQNCLTAMGTVEDAQLCRTRIVSFQDTYAGVQCWAVSVSKTTGVKTRTLVDVDTRMDDLLDIIDKAIDSAYYY